MLLQLASLSSTMQSSNTHSAVFLDLVRNLQASSSSSQSWPEHENQLGSHKEPLQHTLPYVALTSPLLKFQQLIYLVVAVGYAALFFPFPFTLLSTYPTLASPLKRSEKHPSFPTPALSGKA